VRNSQFSTGARKQVSGAILLLIIIAFVAACLASYNNLFSHPARLYLHAERGGLQMFPDNRVLMRGMEIGKVASVARGANGNGVDIALNIDPARLRTVPENVHVSLEQLTAFGSKAAILTIPDGPPAPSIRPDTTLSVDRVTVEANSLFDKLQNVLVTAQPAKVNALLGGFADGLRGNGEKIGELVEVSDRYLGKVNNDLPQLRKDFDNGAKVLDLYAGVSPDLLRILGNVTVTSNTVVDRRDDLHDTLTTVARVANTGERFFASNGDDIISLARNLTPTTALLRKYSPELSCTLQGLDQANKGFLTSDGNTVPGVVSMTTFAPATEPYRYPQDLPNMNADFGPGCHGLPVLEGFKVPPSLNYEFNRSDQKRGTGKNTLELPRRPLVAQLFGGSAVSPRNGYQEQRQQEDARRERNSQGTGEGGR